MPKVTKKERIKVDDGYGYCRKCQQSKPLNQFYEATNLNIDTSGKLSVCRDCCNELYHKYFSIYNNLEIALDLTCRDLDIVYDEDALIQTQSHIDKLLSNGKNANAVFGYYKSKLSSLNKNNTGMESFRYKDSPKFKNAINNLEIHNENQNNDNCDNVIYFSNEDRYELGLFWGDGFTDNQLQYLVNELENWKQTHKCDNRAELTLLKEICIKLLQIRDKRALKESVSNDLKELQDLMKTASVDPAKANVASAGKSHECFGLWVKDIEQFTPAEWFEDQEKYTDMDGFGKYIKNYITRPIENFLAGTRNFIVDDTIDGDLDSTSEDKS